MVVYDIIYQKKAFLQLTNLLFSHHSRSPVSLNVIIRYVWCVCMKNESMPKRGGGGGVRVSSHHSDSSSNSTPPVTS